MSWSGTVRENRQASLGWHWRLQCLGVLPVNGLQLPSYKALPPLAASSPLSLEVLALVNWCCYSPL